MRGAVKFAGAAIAESASYRLDQVLALPIIGAYNTGLYAVAVTMGSAPLSLGHAISASYYPRVAQANGTDRDQLNAEGTRVGLAIALLVCIPLAMITPLVVPLLFGAEFVGAIVPALLSLAGTVALVCGFVASSLLAAAGRGIVMTVAQCCSLVVGIGLLFVLGPPLGAVGASLASSISYVVLSLIVIWALGVRPSAALPHIHDFRLALSTLFKPRK